MCGPGRQGANRGGERGGHRRYPAGRGELLVADDPALPGTYVIAQHVEPALAAQEAVLRQQTTLGLGALAIVFLVHEALIVVDAIVPHELFCILLSS